MSSRAYRLPPNKASEGGNITSDVNEYCEAWDKIAKPLEEKFGWQLMGCDPGFLFQDKWNQTFTIPSRVAIQILEEISGEV